MAPPSRVDDITFTIDLIKSDASLFPADVREMWKQVQIKRLNDKTIQFILPEPFAPFLDYLTFGLLPRHILWSGLQHEQLASAAFYLPRRRPVPTAFKRLIVENGQGDGRGTARL